MPYYQETNFRFQHHLFRNNSCIWQQNTSYNSTQFSRVSESELYAICAGVNEGLHLRSFLLETNICSKLNLRIHTDLYTQDLIKHDIVRILKINTLHNSADLFTKHISKETLHRLIQSIGTRI